MSKVFRYSAGNGRGGFEGQLDADDMDTNGGVDNERTVRNKPVRRAFRSIQQPKGKHQK